LLDELIEKTSELMIDEEEPQEALTKCSRKTAKTDNISAITVFFDEEPRENQHLSEDELSSGFTTVPEDNEETPPEAPVAFKLPESLVPNDHNIKRVTQTKSLGLIVDENLSWEAQFNRTVDKINSGIWALKRLKIYSLSHYFPLSIMHWLKVNYAMVMLFGVVCR